MSAELQTLSPLAQEAAGVRRHFEFSRVVRAAGYVAVLLSLTLAGATFFVLMGLTPIPPTSDVVLTALVVNGALVTFLLLVVGWEIGNLVVARRRGRAAARLHIRIVAFFSIIAATPAILIAIVASITLDRGLDNWFSTRTRAIVDNSLSIARAFADQQAQLLRYDMLGLKSELERANTLFAEDPARFRIFFSSVARAQNLPAAFLVSAAGNLVAKTDDVADTASVPPPPPRVLDAAKARPDQVFVIPPGPNNLVGGVIPLASFDNILLYGVRALDPQIVRYLEMTGESVSEYRAMEASRFGVQLAFGLLYVGMALVVLLSAIWIGIAFANQLVSPIRRLIDAAKEVARGNLEVAVDARNSDGDVGALGTTFNTMTAQLRSQRRELLSASEVLDSRRRFTEAVLSGVPAGVLGIDAEGRVTIANRTALRLLGVSDGELVGKPAVDILPQLAGVVGSALRDDRPEHRDQIAIARGGRERTINVRVTTERTDGQAHGYVVTLDDITDLVTAQRSSAWADVARRIAHEIKNPLTPIQLSAERLKRKFGKTIVEDRSIFDQCTDTIIRQVGDIGRMVDEFSSFARMPKPAFEARNISDSIREAVFLMEVAHPEIAFTMDLPEEPLVGRFDARLMGQALTNVVKNATEAVGAVPPERGEKGAISVAARSDGEAIIVDIVDNGIGLPRENRHRLLEPYMTTREKGTGLGLAIVTKIIEDHGGRIELLDAPAVAEGGHGALIRITLPQNDVTASLAATSPAA